MIFITGDTHIPIDINKLYDFDSSKLTKNDYLIILGDCGLVWSGDKTDKKYQKWFNEQTYTTLFIDGNHENFTLLNNYDITSWNGGNVHKISDRIIHLMRGQVFNIDGFSFFTMGGAESIDKYKRVENVTWWKEELPSAKEFEVGMNNLDKCNWSVDYVLTHTCSNIMRSRMTWHNYNQYNSGLEKYFDILENDLIFKHWYFGHYHEDVKIDTKHTLIYNKIIKL
jgi:hypothetical protein